MTLELEHTFPAFTVAGAQTIARELYGLQAVASPLPGDRDQNFLLRDGEARFVLKLANASEKRELLELENAALATASGSQDCIACPQLRPTLDGEEIAAAAGPDGGRHFVRLVTYLPGRLFAHVDPHTPGLLRSLGRCMAALDQALSGLQHPAARRQLRWDLKHAGWIGAQLSEIETPERRSIVADFLARYEQRASPALDGLRTSVIHNDANDYNLLVNGARESERRVTGILDFGDVVHSCTVFDLAIAIAYAILDKADPLRAATHVARGYDEVLPLAEEELELLFDLVCIRLCITVTNAAHQRKVHPGKSYLTISERPAWAALEQLAAVSPAFAHYAFRDACGLSPCPATHTVVNWLREHQAGCGRVVEPELTAENIVVTPLSVVGRPSSCGTRSKRRGLRSSRCTGT